MMGVCCVYQGNLDRVQQRFFLLDTDISGSIPTEEPFRGILTFVNVTGVELYGLGQWVVQETANRNITYTWKLLS